MASLRRKILWVLGDQDRLCEVCHKVWVRYPPLHGKRVRGDVSAERIPKGWEDGIERYEDCCGMKGGGCDFCHGTPFQHGEPIVKAKKRGWMHEACAKKYFRTHRPQRVSHSP